MRDGVPLECDLWMLSQHACALWLRLQRLMQALSVRNCPGVSDEGVRGVAAALPRLQDLALDDDRAVTAAGISALAQGCPNLQVGLPAGSQH